MSNLQSSTATTSPILDRIVLREPIATTAPQWSKVVLVGGLVIGGYSQWQIQAIRLIKELSSLPPDWDSYGSPPPSRVALITAGQLIFGVDLDPFLTPRVVPVPGGGVQFEWSSGGREVEIEIDSDGSVEFLKTDQRRPLEEGHIASADIGQVRSLLKWLIT